MTANTREFLDRGGPLSLYYQIKEYIKQEIKVGTLRVGDRIPSEREICRIFRVSRITASRAVSDLVIEGTLRREHGIGTFVAGPRSDATMILGVALYDASYLSMPFFSCIIGGMAEFASAAGYHVQLIATGRSDETPAKPLYERVLSERQVDGLAIIDHKVSDEDILDLHEHRVPICLFDRLVAGQDLLNVRVDNRGGVFQIVEHLSDLGHDDIGLIAASRDHPPAKERYEGYRSALDIRGIEFRPEWIIHSGECADDLSGSIARLLDRGAVPTAFVCNDDRVAIETISILNRLGYVVPRDFSVTGFDNVPQASYNFPSITTIDSGLTDMGREMAKILLSVIQGDEVEKRCQMSPARLIVRESTALAPVR